jgi:CRISPR/Cas system-associated exonuclease Cas4 (RecB family)
MSVRLSYSQVDTFNSCPKQHWYARRYKSRQFNINFLIGNIIHEGLHLTYTKTEDLFVLLAKKFDEYIEKERETQIITEESEKKLEEWKVIILGMIYAYNLKYAHFMEDHEHVANEQEYTLDLGNDITFLIKIDNVLRNIKTGELWVHEIKTTRELNENYIFGIQRSVQAACYYHLGQMVPDFRPKGIIYDVLQKPSIRVKKNEDYQDYLNRLQDYYEADPHAHLHMEMISAPAIKSEELLAMITDVGKRIDIGTSYKTWKDCGMCDFRKLCFNDDAPEWLLAFEER